MSVCNLEHYDFYVFDLQSLDYDKCDNVPYKKWLDGYSKTVSVFSVLIMFLFKVLPDFT